MPEEERGEDTRSGRLLRLSVTHVDVKLYRSSRTSANTIKKPPHFEYHVRVQWTGETRPSTAGKCSFATTADEDGQPLYWWDAFPRSYVVKRKWNDIVKLHDEIESTLAYDQVGRRMRVKARMPILPSKGDLDAFILGVAGSGDALVLNRKDPLAESESSALDDIHTIYVECRLRPYLRKVCQVLDEVPADILAKSKLMYQFLLDGRAIQPRYEMPALKPKFMGKQSFALTEEDKVALANRLRKQQAREAAEAEDAGSPAVKKVEPPAAPAQPKKSASTGALPKLSKAEAREMRLQTSHYGFFAKKLRGPHMGMSDRDFWQGMRSKERQEIGRRTLLNVGLPKDQPHPRIGKDLERLGVLRPPGEHDFRYTVEGFGSKLMPRSNSPGRVSSKSASHTQLGAMKTSDDRKDGVRGDVIKRDICESLRVIALGEELPDKGRQRFDALQIPDYPPPDEERTLTAYRTYRVLVNMEESAQDDGERSSSDDENPEANFTVSPNTSIFGVAFRDTPGSGLDPMHFPDEGCNLNPISWQTLLMWSERQQDMALDFRQKSVCAALLRNLTQYWQTLLTPRERAYGVPLSMYLQWIWPAIGPQTMSVMLTWICHYELGKIRQPTPPVIDVVQTRQLTTIFNNMDTEKRGYCTADDIAGGKIQNIEAKLKNIVDAETIRAVVTQPEINLITFMELMCEDNHRAHSAATQVLQEDGHRLVHTTRDAIGFEGWIYKDEDVEPRGWEDGQRKLIDSIEAEVLRWRELARGRGRRSSLWPGCGRSA
eukprot:TRINITY_DN8687_c0_g1_i6.p1 TRINITY_DN8687_c0_g1~~TRINITY_DN8687_c0_g1_i6.p1  ORF type:complete len:772 (-),score=148.00 TRINITY_DN8687_c0_g1_i6:154-2469(-)